MEYPESQVQVLDVHYSYEVAVGMCTDLSHRHHRLHRLLDMVLLRRPDHQLTQLAAKARPKHPGTSILDRPLRHRRDPIVCPYKEANQLDDNHRCRHHGRLLRHYDLMNPYRFLPLLLILPCKFPISLRVDLLLLRPRCYLCPRYHVNILNIIRLPSPRAIGYRYPMRFPPNSVVYPNLKYPRHGSTRRHNPVSARSCQLHMMATILPTDRGVTPLPTRIQTPCIRIHIPPNNNVVYPNLQSPRHGSTRRNPVSTRSFQPRVIATRLPIDRGVTPLPTRIRNPCIRIRIHMLLQHEKSNLKY
jgi:hypothetical protein